MKKLISLLMAVCLIISLAACASPAAESLAAQEQTTVQEPLVPETAAARYPVTLTDQAGRQVTIAAQPQRIVCCYYIATSALIALGLRDRIAALEGNAGKRPIYGLSAPELLELPGVGSAKEFDLEGCIALKPDLVILPLKLKDTAPQLEQLGIPVLLVNPESQALLLDMLELIAAAADVPERAQALGSFLASVMESLPAADEQAPSVYLGGNSAFLSTAGSKMYQSSLITLAGGRNVAADLPDTYWAEISYEQLLTWDPEYIVLAADATYSVEDVRNDPNLSDCRAVRSGKVFRIPNAIESWDSPVPGGILGALWLASVLHPDEITREYTNETISSFYKQFYGFSCQTDSLVPDSVGN